MTAVDLVDGIILCTWVGSVALVSFAYGAMYAWRKDRKHMEGKVRKEIHSRMQQRILRAMAKSPLKLYGGRN